MMPVISLTIEESWKQQLKNEFNRPYFASLKAFLQSEKEHHTVIFPPGNLIFSAFNHTPFHRIKVVILGQDPYHGFGQANGLCFSVSPGVKPPPSLMNIFKELMTDVGMEIPGHGNLESWADQGVFLLNTTLTVREGQAASHQGKGWEQFTDAVIKRISHDRKGIVFLLWGKFAQSKSALIDQEKHLVLTAAHPSPLARGAFFGCKHFSQTNTFLIQNGLTPINWDLHP